MRASAEIRDLGLALALIAEPNGSRLLAGRLARHDRSRRITGTRRLLVKVHLETLRPLH